MLGAIEIFGKVLHYISQNHRIEGVGRDLCGSSSPTPLPKQGHLYVPMYNFPFFPVLSGCLQCAKIKYIFLGM